MTEVEVKNGSKFTDISIEQLRKKQEAWVKERDWEKVYFFVNFIKYNSFIHQGI